MSEEYVNKHTWDDEWDDRWKNTRFSDLLGLTITKIENIEDVALVFYADNTWDEDGKDMIFYMSHAQEDSEVVYIESVTGDINDLIGSTIESASEEVTTMELSQEQIEAFGGGEEFNKLVCTFYRLVTKKGCVKIRWQGNSNGFYDVGVDFRRVTQEGLNVFRVIDAVMGAYLSDPDKD